MRIAALVSLLQFAPSSGFVPDFRCNKVRTSQHDNVFKMTKTDGKDPSLLVSVLNHIGLDDSAKVRLVLASQSPRRKEILDMMMLTGKYSVESPPLDESQLQKKLTEQGIPSADYTRKLAEAKALALAEMHRGNCDSPSRIPTFYLGSDTVVEIEGKILEKPKDCEDAKAMLSTMSGRQHHVHTGVAVYRLMENDISLVSSFTDTATVKFCSLSQETIDAYVETGEPLDKAGSYGIQGVGGQLVTEIRGDFFTVMGLPMHKTSTLLAEAILAELN